MEFCYKQYENLASMVAMGEQMRDTFECCTRTFSKLIVGY